MPRRTPGAPLRIVPAQDAPPTAEEAADAAQGLAQLRLTLLREDPTLLPPVDAAIELLQRIPGVAAELSRRRLGSRV